MRYKLFDFQNKAVDKLIDKMIKMQKHWHEDKELSSVSLTAPTGAGKTVICAAVAEGLFKGNSRIGDDPHAVILWLSDNPSLNEQTKHRFAVAADDLNENTDMVVIDANFAKNHNILEPHHIYFLNRQKLVGNLGKSSEGGRTFWDVLTETINNDDINLYLMIDEAHKGLGTGSNKATSDSENKTIYAKLIDGQPGINPPMPVVIGISATPERWKRAMGDRDNRIAVPPVKVPTEEVRKAGIIKEIIELRSPKVVANARQQDLILACKKLAESSKHWKDYHKKNGENLIVPLLVVQVEDKISNASLVEICKIIHEVLPELEIQSCFANVFGQHEDFGNEMFSIPYVPAEKVQENEEIRVLFAKDAISTGWDCPRAEVLYSRRKRQDTTYIQQMLGRMIRTPLAKKINSDDFLNSVMCYLPEYDAKAVKEVADLIKNDNDMGKTTNTVVNPVETGWYSGIKQTAEAAVNISSDENNNNYTEVEAGVRTAINNDIPLADGLENISVTTDVQGDLFTDSGNNDVNIVNEPPETPSELGGKDITGNGGLTEVCIKPIKTEPEKPKKPVKVDIPTVQGVINNLPVTNGPKDDDAVKASFEGIVTRHVENKKIEKFRVLFNCINLLTEVVDLEGNTWENDDDLKIEFCNQIESAITAHPQEFKRDLREATTRKQTVLKVDALTGEQVESLADERVEVFQIRLAGFDENTYYNEACRKFCNKDYVKAYFDYMKTEKDMDDSDINNRLWGIIHCISVFTDLELWAERKTKELIEKHDGNKGRLNDDERNRWDEVIGNTRPWVEKTLSAPKKVYNQSSDYKGYRKHVIVSSNGLAHIKLNDFEDNVVEKEIADSYNIAWYRNEARNMNSSLSIPYKKSSEGYENFYPDFIFFEKTNDGKINRNIIDPHGVYLDDYLPRLKGYIEYLKDHGDDFGKVLAIGDISSSEYRSLDLKNPAVVKAIEEFTGDSVMGLFTGKVSRPYWKSKK